MNSDVSEQGLKNDMTRLNPTAMPYAVPENSRSRGPVKEFLLKQDSSKVSSNRSTKLDQTSLHRSIYATQIPKPSEEKIIDPNFALAEFQRRAAQSSIKVGIPEQNAIEVNKQKGEHEPSGPSRQLALPSTSDDNIVIETSRRGNGSRAAEGSPLSNGLSRPANNGHPIQHSFDSLLEERPLDLAAPTPWPCTSTAQVSDFCSRDILSLGQNLVDFSHTEADVGNGNPLPSNVSTFLYSGLIPRNGEYETVTNQNDETLTQISQAVESVKRKRWRDECQPRLPESIEHDTPSFPSRGPQLFGASLNPFTRRSAVNQNLSTSPIDDSNPDGLPYHPSTIWIKHAVIKLTAGQGTITLGYLNERAYDFAEVLLKMDVNAVGLPTISFIGRVSGNTASSPSPSSQTLVPPFREYSIQFTLPACVELADLDLGTVSDDLLLPYAIRCMLVQQGLDENMVPSNLRHMSFTYKAVIMKGFKEAKIAEEKKKGEANYMHEDSEKVLYFMNHLASNHRGRIKVWFLADNEINKNEIDGMFAFMKRVCERAKMVDGKLIAGIRTVFGRTEWFNRGIVWKKYIVHGRIAWRL